MARRAAAAFVAPDHGGSDQHVRRDLYSAWLALFVQVDGWMRPGLMKLGAYRPATSACGNPSSQSCKQGAAGALTLA